MEGGKDMKEHVFNYEDLTLEDLEVLCLYHEYICDGDNKIIIVKEK